MHYIMIITSPEDIEAYQVRSVSEQSWLVRMRSNHAMLSCPVFFFADSPPGRLMHVTQNGPMIFLIFQALDVNILFTPLCKCQDLCNRLHQLLARSQQFNGLFVMNFSGTAFMGRMLLTAAGIVCSPLQTTLE